jgi:Zn-dependent oligopeptidase
MNKLFNYSIINYNKDNIIKIMNNAFEKCKQLIISFKKSNDEKEKFNLINQYFYINNYFYIMIGVIHLLNNEININDLEIIIKQHDREFYKDTTIYNFLVSISEHTFDNEKIILISKILKKFKEHKKIENNICDNICSEILKELTQKTKINNKNITLNYKIYKKIIEKIKSKKERTKIENIYYSNANLCIDKLANLLIERHNFAKSLDYENFFQYKKQKNINNTKQLKNLICDLSNVLDTRMEKEIDRIRNEMRKNKDNSLVSLSDFIYYTKKLQSKIKFSLNQIIKTIFYIIKQYFGITFKKIVSSENKNNNLLIFECHDTNKTSLGLVYFDLIKRKNKKFNKIISICTNNKFLNIPAQIYLIGCYSNYSNNIIGFDDVVIIFREFGYIIENLYKNTQYGFNFCETEFKSVMPHIMEYICWENSTMKYLLGNISNINETIDHLKFIRYIDFAKKLKIKCINATFDHFIHSSDKLIDEIKNNSYVLKNIYHKIFCDAMKNSNGIDLNKNYFDPQLILYIVSGYEGILYSDIFTNILSYTIFTEIKRTNSLYYIQNILINNKNTSMKSINDYINKINIDTYNLFINDIVNYNEIDTENNNEKNNLITDLVSDTNMFYSHDIVTDNVENIIVI